MATMAATAATHKAEQTHLAVHTHTLTHQGVRSCSANAVLQDAVISVRAAKRVKTLRSEISIAGWNGMRERERGGAVKTKKRPGLKQSVRFQCYSWVRGQP